MGKVLRLGPGHAARLARLESLTDRLNVGANEKSKVNQSVAFSKYL
jgi:hypothetical protein